MAKKGLVGAKKLKEIAEYFPAIEHNDIGRGLYEFFDLWCGLAAECATWAIFESGLFGDPSWAEERYNQSVEFFEMKSKLKIEYRDTMVLEECISYEEAEARANLLVDSMFPDEDFHAKFKGEAETI